MRIKTVVITAALLLASASIAWAQGVAQVPVLSPPQTTITAESLGWIDFGFRGTSVSGDQARYERYRDLRDGAYSALSFAKQTDTKIYKATAFNVGYHDQAYRGDYNDGRLKAYGMFAGIPTNFSYLTSTPWVRTINGSTVNYALDDAAQGAVQSKTPGVVGVPQNVANLATRSIYAGLAQPFDMQMRRDTTAAGVSYDLTPGFNLNMTYASTKKTGTMPWDASFAFNNANELALPLNNRTNDTTVAAEWSFTDGLVRVAWDGSWFNNAYHDIVWDNPLQLTDFNNGKVPPNGPYDPSGYSNGNGPAMGRMSLAPDNSMNVISAMGLYRMPAHSTLNGQVSFTDMRQNDSLIPWTINPVIAQPLIYASFPNLAQLPRNTAEAEVKGLNALFNFNSRPNRIFAFAMRYRFNDHNNETPAFNGVEYVRFDAVPEETGSETEQFDVKRRTLDANAIFHLLPSTAVKVGYGFDSFNRTGRSFSDTTDDIFRLSVDTMQLQWMQVRGGYEHIVRVGSGFSSDALEEGGAQPGLRFYDEADRTRDRGNILLTFTPWSPMDVTFQYSAAKDVYNGEGHMFGLMDTHNQTYNVGFNFTPRTDMAFGLNYGRDTYKAFQQSANANPSCTLNVPPCPPGTYDSWTDPNRIWNLQNNETVNNFNLYFDLVGALKNTDIRIMYDFSDSDNAFLHGGPRIQELSTNTALTPGDTAPCSGGVSSCFIPLPNVTNQWQRFSADVRYYFTHKVGVGFGWYYDKLDVSDFATIDTNGSVGYTPATGVPRIDYLGEINTGYGVRPYNGNTVTIRLLYKF
jgi:MtrB/PioB family decaheme-associated outer membrane protein